MNTDSLMLRVGCRGAPQQQDAGMIQDHSDMHTVSCTSQEYLHDL